MKKFYIYTMLVGLCCFSMMKSEEIDEMRTRGIHTWAAGEDHQKASGLITSRNMNNATATSGTMLDLTTSGRYYLNANLAVDPQNSGVTCIKISASNITLDMRGHTLSSTRVNLATGIIAIEVAANLYNVQIKNGTLSGMDGTGIKVNSGCTGLKIENMFVDNCTLVGVTIAANCHNFNMKDTIITRCDGSHSGSDGAVGFRIQSSNVIKIERCCFDLNQHATTGHAMGVYATSCSHAVFINCSAHHNKAGTASGNAAYGFRIDGASNYSHLIQCEANKNISQNGPVYGFSVDAATGGSELMESHADNNTAVGGDCHGFSFTSSSDFILISRCNAQGNTGDNHVYGFKFNASDYVAVHHCVALGQSTTGTTKNCYGFYSTGGNGNTFQDCKSFGNKASASGAATSAGFCLAGSEKYTNIIRCESKSNLGGAGTAYGIYLESAASCTIKANEIFVNTGTTDGFGIKDATANSISCYIENVAYGNSKTDGSTVDNYSVRLSPNNSENTFPVREAFLTDFINLKQINLFDNIELIEKANVETLRG